MEDQYKKHMPLSVYNFNSEYIIITLKIFKGLGLACNLLIKHNAKIATLMM